LGLILGVVVGFRVPVGGVDVGEVMVEGALIVEGVYDGGFGDSVVVVEVVAE
jgi:hypothetical protein